MMSLQNFLGKCCLAGFVLMFVWINGPGLPLGNAEVLGGQILNLNIYRAQNKKFYSIEAQKDFPLSNLARIPVSSRTPMTQVGAIMALLATFEEARVLPPEGSPEANQLIHALIQFQSAFMKSQNHAIKTYLSRALASYFFDRSPSVEKTFFANGWTSEVLEAVLLYESYPGVWSDPNLEAGFKAFNVNRGDLKELQFVFDQARLHFLRQGKDIHEVYRFRRKEMPGVR